MVNDELPAIREGFKDFKADYRPKFVVVVVSKRHWKRFFLQQGNRINETEPGTVIDTKIVRADMDEFYLQSHRALLVSKNEYKPE